MWGSPHPVQPGHRPHLYEANAVAVAEAGLVIENGAAYDTFLPPLLSAGPAQAVLRAIRRRCPGAPVAYTERLPGYLLQAPGLRVLTPPGFAAAIEDGNEPGAGDTLAMDQLLTGRKVRVLLYNAQAVSPGTQHARDLARRAGIPVLVITRDHGPGVPQLPGLAADSGQRPATRARGTTMNGPGGAAIALRAATLRCGHHLIWGHPDLEVAPGEWLAVLGPNGAGKTTLLKCCWGSSAVRRHGDHRRPATSAGQPADRVPDPAADVQP